MIDLVVRAELRSSVESREQYKEFCERIESQHEDGTVSSAEIGGEARIKIKVAEEEYLQGNYRSKFECLERVEKVKTIEKLAE